MTLKEYRRTVLQVSVRELAEAFPISQQRLYSVEAGRDIPLFRHKRQFFANVYGMSLEQFDRITGFAAGREGDRRSSGGAQAKRRRVRDAG
jgi:hypothetical protein